MDFLTFWMALGAMAISVFALWYSKRQADAAESANRRAARAERAMHFRWQVVPNGGEGKDYLLVNTGTADAYNVDVVLPEFMAGNEIHVEHIAPLSQFAFSGWVKPSYLEQAPNIPRLITIKWEDRLYKEVVHREALTTLQEH